MGGVLYPTTTTGTPANGRWFRSGRRDIISYTVLSLTAHEDSNHIGFYGFDWL